MLSKTLAWFLIGSLLGGLSSCSSVPGMENPAVTISPYGAFYQLRGDTSMQSASGGILINNPKMELGEFGWQSHSDDFGIRATFGDGFSGIQAEWFLYDDKSQAKGTLTSEWGEMLAGDDVRMQVKMNEYRIGYVGQLFDWSTPVRENDLRFGLGLGGNYVFRDMTIEVEQDPDRLRTQRLEVDGDGSLYGIARGRVAWAGASLNVDFGISPSSHLGGDWDETTQDLEITLAYFLENQNVTLFAGYRRAELLARGPEGSLEYDIDFVMDGFQAGFAVTF